MTTKTLSADARPGPQPIAPAAASVDVIPRDIHFDTGDAPAAAWLGGDRVGTAVFNALSLTFPNGERMFMDSVRNYRPLLSGTLLAEANAFIKQEAIHTREHVGLNAGLDRRHYPIDAIEAELEKRTAYAKERGPVAMIAVTIALEHFTAMMADLLLEKDVLLAKAPPEIRRLWQWHAMEETEHKAVAFDVFHEALKGWTPSRRYLLRTRIMVIISVLFSINITRFSARLLIADGMNAWEAHARTFWYLFGRPGLFRTSWRSYWSWYKPGFHPWQHDNRRLLSLWRNVFAEEPSPAPGVRSAASLLGVAVGGGVR